MKNRIKILILVILSMALFTGCTNIDEYITDYAKQVSTRVTLNLKEVERLEKAGILAPDIADSLRVGINSNLKRLGVEQNDDETTTTGSIESLLKSLGPNIVDSTMDTINGGFWDKLVDHAKNWNISIPENRDKAVGYDIVATDAADRTGVGKGGMASINDMINLKIYVLKKAPAKEGDSEYNSYIELNDLLNKTAIDNKKSDVDLNFSTGENSNTNVTVEQNKDAINSILDTWFIDSGRVILDPADSKNAIFKDSVSQEGAKTAQGFTDAFPQGHQGLIPDSAKPANALGKDMVVYKIETEENDDGTTNEYVRHAIQIRLHEFNRDAVDKIVGKDSVASNIYYCPANGTNKCYLMEYPVFCVSGFQTTDGVHFIPQYVLSDLQVNIITGEVHFRDGSLVTSDAINDTRYHVTPGDGGSSFVLDAVSRYGIKADSTHEAADIDTTSKTQLEASAAGYKSWYQEYISNYGMIAFSKEAKESTEKDIQGAATAAETAYKENLPNYGSIVLRDYLEYTYLPEVVSGENLVALGRMLRINTFSGQVTPTDNGVIGEFVGKSGIIQSEMDVEDTVTSGNIVEQQQGRGQGPVQKQEGYKVSVRDIMAFKPALDGKAVKLRFNAYNPTEGTTGANGETAEPVTEATTADTERGLLDTRNSSAMQKIYTDRMVGNNQEEEGGYYTSHRFPGTFIARPDMNALALQVQGNNIGDGTAKVGSQIKPVFYGIAMDSSIFGSKLYSSWINVEGDGGSFGSLNYWNAWLQKKGYTYQIDRNKVMKSVSGIYNFDVTGNGYILLNLDTISKIQSIYDKQEKMDVLNFWRTIMVLIGLVCIIFACLLPITWLYDTNISVGPRLLTFVTAGKWVAVTENYTSDEIRAVMGDHRIAVTLGKTIEYALIVMSLGILLCFIDPIAIIDFIVVVFGKLGSFIENALTGL